MWRKNRFTENQDSDQSISEEEELDDDLPENCISLGGHAEKKGGVQVLSQLEVLRDAHEMDHAIKPTILSQKRQEGFCIQDEAEIPVFNNEGDFVRFRRRASTCNSDDEIISDDEVESKVKENNMLSTKSITLVAENFQKVSLPSFGSTRKDGACTWSSAIREAEALVHLNENAGCSSSRSVLSKANKSFKGSRGKAKAKFSFHFQPHKDPFEAINSKDEAQMLSKVTSLHEESESIEHRTMENSMSELLELFQGENIQELEHSAPAEVAVGHDHTKHSMAGLLDCFQENNALLVGNSIMHSRTEEEMAQLLVKRGVSPLADRNIEDDLPEAFDSGPSSGDEDNHPNLKLFIPESKRKTMADQFQEALGAASINDEGLLFALPRQSGVGLFGKLQRVMQSEKEREMDFLKRLQTEASLTDEGSCIDVRILSKCLDAKMTVCCCSFIGDEESWQCVGNPKMREENGGRTSTIIFSSRTCSDVELEVGKLIRIHHPWKEICVTGKDEIIILATYFSHIST